MELGELDISGKIWQVKLESGRTDEALFEAGNILVRVTDCSLNEAREIMNHLPTTAPFLMYHHQAKRLIRELKKIQVQGIITNQ